MYKSEVTSLNNTSTTTTNGTSKKLSSLLNQVIKLLCVWIRWAWRQCWHNNQIIKIMFLITTISSQSSITAQAQVKIKLQIWVNPIPLILLMAWKKKMDRLKKVTSKFLKSGVKQMVKITLVESAKLTKIESLFC